MYFPSPMMIRSMNGSLFYLDKNELEMEIQGHFSASGNIGGIPIFVTLLNFVNCFYTFLISDFLNTVADQAENSVSSLFN